MKKEFSTSWISSTQKRKQRKYRHNAPLHVKHSFLNAPLSKDLRKKHGKRSFPVRKGDSVLVKRGAFRKKTAKVVFVDHKKSRMTLENIQRSKKDGTKVNVYFHASKVQLTSLNLDDKKRVAAIERKITSQNKNSKPAKEKQTKEKKNASN